MTRMEECRTAFKIFTDKHAGKRSPGRPERRCDEWILKKLSLQRIELIWLKIGIIRALGL